jgi:hypothetical protein
MDTQPLLKEACSAVFGSAAGLVDMLVQHVPSSKRATAKKVQQDFTGRRGGRVGLQWQEEGGCGRQYGLSVSAYHKTRGEAVS